MNSTMPLYRICSSAAPNKDLFENRRFGWCCSAVVRPLSCIQAVAAATWFGRLAETNFEFPFDFARIISGLRCTIEASVTEAEKRVREYLAKIGRRGGLTSRRELTRSRAKQMVAIREAKRAAMKAGKPWPPRDRKLLTST
jgi:hypothetical protein